ncbi:MAG TPA: P-loop NTPase fold protein [Methylocella sp.]|nr:P-loop NTPase fold protein [Methylocella sp.]
MSLADLRLRDLGMIVPGRLASHEATSPPAPAATEQGSAPERPAPQERVFAADLPEGNDALGLAAPLGLLAELAAHKRTETPLTIGIFGAPGSGKSFALSELIQAIEELSQGAATAGSPYVGEIVTLRVDATEITGNPATALVSVLHACLAKKYPALAAEAARAARDPRAAASEALERLDACRRKLEAEKHARDETSTRRARLAETILYETAGSQVDAYANANRARIKNLLARLGVQGDFLMAFKEMAGSVASTNGGPRRIGFALRAFFGFKGQIRLIVTASLLFLAGMGLRTAVDEQESWLAWLRGNDSLMAVANWLEAHMDLLLGLRSIILAGAALALGVAVWRGAQLLRLVFRGADLLRADVGVRRRELEELFAFQARRVEALAAEVNLLSRRASEAERRAGDLHAGSSAFAEPALFTVDVAPQQAQAFAAAAGGMLARPDQAQMTKSGKMLRRIVFALDHLDAVPASRGREILAQTRSLFKQGFVVLAAADPARLMGTTDESAADLAKWIQIPFRLDELATRANYATLVGQMLGAQAIGERRSRDIESSLLDEPLSAAEVRLLAALAALAGSSARALKRFVNLYRLVRAQSPDHKGALAFMLALEAGGTRSEIAAVNEVLFQTGPELDFALQDGGPRLIEALAAAQSVDGRISVSAARQAASIGRLFSFGRCDFKG